MCNIIRLHAMFKQAGNKYDSQTQQDFPAPFIDDFIHDAQLDLIHKITTSDGIRGIETDSQRINLLQPFLKTELLKPAYRKVRGKQNITIFSLPTDYFATTENIFSFDECGNLIKVQLVSQQNINSYTDTNRKLDQQLLWSQAYATTQQDKLHIYYPEKLKSLEFNYIIIPPKPFSGGYDTLEYTLGDKTKPSAQDSRVDSLIPDAYCHTLIDIAVANVFGNLRDYNLAQYKQQNLNL